MHGGVGSESHVRIEMRLISEETTDHFSPYDLFMYGIRLRVLVIEALRRRAGAGANHRRGEPT